MNDTQTLTLTEFLLARIAEDEETATRAATTFGDIFVSGGAFVCESQGSHIGLSVGRIRAECAAKRRIVDELDLRTCGPCARAERCVNHDASAGGGRQRLFDWTSERILWNLALPYADHPDYRQEWKP